VIRRPSLAVVTLAFFATGCGGSPEPAAAPEQTPVERCTDTVLAALETAYEPRGDSEGVLLQLTNDYGTNSAEYMTFIASAHTDFHNIRSAEGMRAGLDYVRPYIANGCAADWSTRPNGF
jgi:hypothetical protein